MKKLILVMITGGIILSTTQISRAAEPSEAALAAQAKVTRKEASVTALGKVKQGVIKSAELEKEHGRLVWSFDIALPSTSGVTEVQVDAVTGKVLSVERESAAKEAKEAIDEKAGARAH